MGRAHAQTIAGLPMATLAAVCDISSEAVERVTTEHKCKGYGNAGDLIESGAVDAVLIATPHYDHTTIGIQALQAGLHVLVEKPISVHKADCERLIAAHTNKQQVFAAMFNQRTDPHYRRVKNLIESGELGDITRVNWIITSWFRPDAYYASGGWRATWAGEGGGVLMNQSPHQLDLLQWLCGMPEKVRASCHIGKYHDIEVEDEVTAYMEYPNGATGVFITSTGEAPGANRLEICGDRGRLTVENGAIHFCRNEIGQREFSATTKSVFSRPPVWNIDIPVAGKGDQHTGIITNFLNAILHGAELIAPAAEGAHSVELANAMLYSSFTGRTVTLPLDSAAYEKKLQELISRSTFRKRTANATAEDITASF